MKLPIASVVALALIGFTSAYAEEKKVDTKAPGTEATEAMDTQVPTMKGDCAKGAKVDTKAPGTEATEAMSKEVPNMKSADASDCVDESGSTTTK
jgi:hypothetical protein